MLAKQGMSQSTGTLTLRQVRAVCTQREPTGRVIIVIVAESEEREDKRGKREEKERRERERTTEERKREGTREREKRTPHTSPLPSSPCVRSQRFRVYWQNARMLNTCRRFAGTHGCVLNLHTETFFTYTRGVFRVPGRATHRQHTPHRTHTTHTTHTHHRHHTPHIAHQHHT